MQQKGTISKTFRGLRQSTITPNLDHGRPTSTRCVSFRRVSVGQGTRSGGSVQTQKVVHRQAHRGQSWDRSVAAWASSSELCTQSSHLCVSSGGPLGDGMSGRFSRSTGSPSWPILGSCHEAVRAAGRRPISQPPRRCLQRRRNVLTSLQHMSEVVRTKTANTTQS